MTKAKGMLPDDLHGGRVIFLLINSHDKHWSIGRGGGHNHTLCSTLDVSLWLAERKRAQVRNQTTWQPVNLFLYVCMCVHTLALSTLRKTPVDSTTYLAPASPQGISAGFMLESEKEQSNSRWNGLSLLLSIVKYVGQRLASNTDIQQKWKQQKQTDIEQVTWNLVWIVNPVLSKSVCRASLENDILVKNRG